MKLKVRRSVARAALWTGIGGGVVIAAATSWASWGVRPLEQLYALTGPWPPVSFVAVCLLVAAVRMMRKTPELAGVSLWLGVTRYAVNIAFPVAAIILLPVWLIAVVLSTLAAPYLLHALLLTLVLFVMTTLSVGLALDLALLLTRPGEKPSAS